MIGSRSGHGIDGGVNGHWLDECHDDFLLLQLPSVEHARKRRSGKEDRRKSR